MQIDTKQIVSMTEANQNFSKVAHVAEKNGVAIIMKNNKPRFFLVDSGSYVSLTDDEKIDIVAKRILAEHKKAFEELAK